MENIFYNREEARIRALWRILIQASIAAVLAAVLTVGVVKPIESLNANGSIGIDKDLYKILMNILGGLLFTFTMLASMKISGKYFDKKKLSSFGFKINGVWFKQYVYGFSLGAALMTCIFLFELAAGFITIDKYFFTAVTGAPMILVFTYPVIKMVCVGIYEEALSRGYHLTNIREGFTGIGKIDGKMAAAIAVFITSAMFGFFHIGNPNASMFGVLNTVAAGVFLGCAFLATKQLAMPIGIHMSWNLFQGLVFGFPVSGDIEKAQIISSSQNGPEWLTGGAYGPEAGLTGLVAIFIGLIIIYLYFKKQQNKQNIIFSGY